MKTLILKSDRGSFERFYIEQMQRENIDVSSFYRPLKEIMRYVSLIHIQKLNLPFSSIWYGNWKKYIQNYEEVIIFDRNYNWNIVEYIHRKNPNCRIIIWYWNPINQLKRIPQKYLEYCEEWSFDFGDCKKYYMRYNNQFTFSKVFDKKNNHRIKWKLYFVGADKGRAEQLCFIKKCAEADGLKVKFIVTRDKTSNNSEIEYSMPITYEDNLKYLYSSECIVEILQREQEGLSVRCLEALFLQKKIITNNSKIVQYEFYNPNNFFVIKKNNLTKESLHDFLSMPYVTVDQSVIKKYDFINWLNNFKSQ